MMHGVIFCLSIEHAEWLIYRMNLNVFCLVYVYICMCVIITPRRVGGGGVKQLVLSVRPSVCPVSVHSKIAI